MESRIRVISQCSAYCGLEVNVTEITFLPSSFGSLWSGIEEMPAPGGLERLTCPSPSVKSDWNESRSRHSINVYRINDRNMPTDRLVSVFTHDYSQIDIQHSQKYYKPVSTSANLPPSFWQRPVHSHEFQPHYFLLSQGTQSTTYLLSLQDLLSLLPYRII